MRQLHAYVVNEFIVRLRANGRNIVDQQLPTLLDATCCVRLHTLLHVVACCCAKFETGQTFQPTTSNSSNNVGATHAHYAWFTKTYGLYPSHDALQVPTLLGVVASVCTPRPTRTQQLPTLLAQCWELLRPFSRSLRVLGIRKWPIIRFFKNYWMRLWE